MNKVVNDDGREVEEVGRQVTCASNYNFPSIILASFLSLSFSLSHPNSRRRIII